MMSDECRMGNDEFLNDKFPIPHFQFIIPHSSFVIRHLKCHPKPIIKWLG